jgi:hypothetical protein
VLHWFSKATLNRLLESEGFVRVAQGQPPRWISVGHAKTVLRQKADTSLLNRLILAASAIVPDRLAVPYPYDDLIWMLFRHGNAARTPDLPPLVSGVEPAGAMCK